MSNNIDARALAVGTVLCSGKYLIKNILGKGGFGITYLAVHNVLGSKYAIKEFFINGYCTRNTIDRTVNLQGITNEGYEKYRQKFIDEANVLAQLDHPNIVKIIDIFNENNTTYIVMPLIEGNTIQKIVETSSSPFPIDYAINYIAQISEAVNYIHNKNILHRDIKPDNIIIDKNDKAILIDFGSAREFINDKTQKHTSILTQGYAPIEQYSSTSRKGSYSDIYSLGATLYFMLSAQKPMDAGTRMLETIPSVKELNPNIPDAWNNTIMKAMEIKPENRYQNINDFMNDLLGKTQSHNTKENIIEKQEQKTTEETKEISVENTTENTDIQINNNTIEEKNTNSTPIPPEKKKKKKTMIFGLCSLFLAFLAGIVTITAIVENFIFYPIFILTLIGIFFGIIGSKKRLKVLAIIGLILNLIIAIVYGIFLCNKLDRKREIINYIENSMVRVSGNKVELGYTWDEYSLVNKYDYWYETYVPRKEKNLIYNFEKRHTKYINDFKINQYEVTTTLWNAVMYDNELSKFDKAPKGNINWYDVDKFIDKLNKITGKRYRLPDEWEWEYAARGGALSENYKYAGGNDYKKLMWCGDYSWNATKSRWENTGGGNSNGHAHSVGGKQANELGLYDMSGNLWEWCSNDYEAPNGKTYNTKTLRGGSFEHSERSCYVSFRLNMPPDTRQKTYGFRLAEDCY